MAKPLASYDAAQVSLIVGGFELSGWADGTFCNVTMDEDAFGLAIGSDGEGARSKTNNRSATITVTLLQTSDSNDIMSAFAQADELVNAGLFPLLIKDNSGRSLHTAANAWVQKFPDAEYARETGSREWVIRTDSLVNFVGGNA